MGTLSTLCDNDGNISLGGHFEGNEEPWNPKNERLRVMKTHKHLLMLSIKWA
jgi:hypothetical protein